MPIAPIIKTSYTQQGVRIKYITRDEKGRFTGSYRAELPREEAKRLFTSLQKKQKTPAQVGGIIKSYSKVTIQAQRRNAMDGLFQVIDNYYHLSDSQRNKLVRAFNSMNMSDFAGFYDENSDIVQKVWGYSEYVKGKGQVEVYSDAEKQEQYKTLMRRVQKYAKAHDIRIQTGADVKESEYIWRSKPKY